MPRLVFLCLLSSHLVAGCGLATCADGFVAALGDCVAEDSVPAPTCTPACSATGHQVCGGTLEEPACECAPGYGGNPCTWGTVPSDPGFSSNAGAWTTRTGANVVPTDPTPPTDPGLARLEGVVNCDAGSVSQIVQMPPYEVADPFVAEVTYRATGGVGFAVGFDRAWRRLLSTAELTWTTERFCLGEAAYGADVNLQVSAFERSPSCPDGGGIAEFDRLQIVVAEPGECPTPGEVVNGDAELDGAPWVFAATNAAEAGFVGGVGRDGSSGARLLSARADSNDTAAMSTVVSVPLPSTTPSPALRFFWRATSSRVFQVEIGTVDRAGSGTLRPLGTLRGSDSDESAIYCLPPWTHGNVVDLVFVMTGLEGDALRSELVVDDVEVISDSRCGDSTETLDPRFDATLSPRAGTKTFGTESTFRVVEDANRARVEEADDPTGFLEVRIGSTEPADTVRMDEWVFVPESDEDGGPRVSFWANVPRDPAVPVLRFVGVVDDEVGTIEATGDWVRNDNCLPPEWENRWYRLQIEIGDRAAASGEPLSPPETILIDDLVVDTAPECPSLE
ncbi:MAG: hypothetical protein AAGF12_39855 [Myxococcota bacterium]